MKDFYYILGVENSTDVNAIKEAHRKLSKKFHPDLNAGDAFFEQRFKDIQEAYETLVDAGRRRIYDTQYACLQQGGQKKPSAQEPFLNELEKKIFEYRNQCDSVRKQQTAFEAQRPTYAPAATFDLQRLVLQYKWSAGGSLIAVIFACFFSLAPSQTTIGLLLKMLSDGILLGAAVGVVVVLVALLLKK
ncbi:MAG: hypothetical protein A2Y14_04850 [Verrucomicrobia bacterium GWF2_51_19]|nr:MAG: hypothetical protein A2Y14_04850 [Verrucomicrobia bacterium GWF2_51_19]HCJ11548.1 hypothetical protein [Opitutae bacterium]